jgi:hypothetical protein
LNQAYVNSLVKQLESVQSCADITAILNSATAELNGIISSATSEISALQNLLVSPTNLTGCISWINNAISYYSAQTATLTQLVADATAAIATVTDAVSEAKARLNC